MDKGDCDCEVCQQLRAAQQEGVEPAIDRKAFRRKVLLSAVVAIVGVLSTIGSIVGQGVAYRQMLAVERIEKHLEDKCSK